MKDLQLQSIRRMATPLAGRLRDAQALRQRLGAVVVPVLIPTVSVLFWLLSLPRINPRLMNDLGLVSVLPPTFFVAVALLTCGFCVTLHRRPLSVPTVMLFVGILILILYGTPALVEDSPRISVAWRHVGLSDYFLHHASTNTKIDAYFSWPGLFVLGAFITKAMGLQSLIGIVAWAHVFFNLLYLAPLVVIFRSATDDQRFVWTGIWLFYLTNWVGQDYFSPQAFAYFLYLVLFAVLLARFQAATADSISLSALSARLLSARPGLARLLRGSRQQSSWVFSSPGQRVGLMALVIIIYAAMVPSHQLTPIAALIGVALLAILDRISPRAVVILMAIMLGAWFVFMADAYLSGHLQSHVGSFGEFDQNLNRGVGARVKGSPEHIFVVRMRVLMTLVVGLLAIAGFGRRLLRGYRDWPIACLAGAPLLLVSLQYGGEMFLRVYFFALPMLAFFAAAFFYPEPRAVDGGPSAEIRLLSRLPGRSRARGIAERARRRLDGSLAWSWHTPVALGVATMLLFGSFLITRYGNERMDFFTSNEVAAAQYIYDTAAPGSTILAPGISVPWQYQDYASIHTHWLKNDIVRDADVEALYEVMSSNRPAVSYLLITRSAQATEELYFRAGPGALDRLEEAMQESGKFEIYYQNPDARVYVLVRTDPQKGPQ